MSVIKDGWIYDTKYNNYLNECDNDVKEYFKKKLCKDVYNYLLTFLTYETFKIKTIHRVKGEKIYKKVIHKKEKINNKEWIYFTDYYDNNLKMERRLMKCDVYGFNINYKSKEEDYKVFNNVKLNYTINAKVYLYRILCSMKNYDNLY